MTDTRLAYPAPRTRVVDVSPSALLAGLAMAGLVFVSLLGPLGAIAFLGAGALLVLGRPALILAEARSYAWAWVLPLWCVLSVLWSDEPDLTLRFAVQFALTTVVAVAIGNRVAPAAFFRALVVVYSLAMLLSIGIGQVRVDGAWLGIFGSKNAFAATVGVFVLLAASVAADRAQPGLARILGLAGLAVGLFLLVSAQSAGALVITLGALGALPLLRLASRLSPAQRLAVATMAVLAVLLALILLIGFRDAIFDALLDATGKDVTLTGRTDLWDVAFRLIGERPLLGVGYQAFWVQGRPEAEMLWAMFGIEARSGFNFHNTYISNAVEIGVFGVALQVALLAAALWLALRAALARPSAVTLFYATFMLQLIAQSFIEVVAFFQFSPRSVIVPALIVHAALVIRRATTPAPGRPAA